MRMLICQDCGSHNIVEVEHWQAYFKEGEWIRLRSITIRYDANMYEDVKGYEAKCLELSNDICGLSQNKILAVQTLGEALHKEFPSITLLGKDLER